MNDEEKTIQTAEAAPAMNLGGAASANGNGEIEALRRELQSSKVEAGRVKALAQQLKDKDDEIAKLKQELETLRANGGNRDYMADIPENLRDSIDETAVKAVGQMMDKRLRERDEEYRRMEAERNEQTRAMRNQEFLARVDREFPGFLQATNPGGDKQEAWEKFLRIYGASVRSAVNSFDFDALSGLITAFYREIGVPANRNAGTAITPRPVLSDGAQPNGDARVYTFAEYQTTLEKAGEDLRAGNIDRAKYRAICAELESAVNEGRVTRQ